MAKGKNTGQLLEDASAPFAEVMRDVPEPLMGLAGTYNDIGEKSGFETTGFIDKKSMPYGENAKLNFLPPGDEIENQENKDIRKMQLKKLTEESYPGDGWMPKPKLVV